MYVSYEHYRVFYYVAKCGNVTQAAKLLLNNQPNVTRTIKNLEAELGCTLFSRSNRGMRLTTEGARLYEHIRIAFSHIEAAEEEILDSRNLRTGMVYIAASEVALRCSAAPGIEAVSPAVSGDSHTDQQPFHTTGNRVSQSGNGGFCGGNDADG